MPDRDAWWSTYLHEAWRSERAVDRLVDWAWSITPDTSVDDESVELCAISLCWMLTASNRHLRDRSTKALVNLLTGRLDAVVRLVELFAELDDPYVVERVYAVAYGAAMRCYDLVRVGHLAESVYNFVFAAGAPPAHILLRDYARGVVERALNLGARIDVEVERIRPPYRSTWPNIPTEEEIRPFMPDWSRGAHDSRDLEWARNRIGSSVMNDDFARYVIGTNSSSINHEWLAVGLEEPIWVSVEEQIAELISAFSVEARSAWETFDNAEIKLLGAKFFASLPDVIVDKFETAVSVVNENGVEDENSSGSIGAISSPDVAELENSREIALSALKSLISDGQVSRLEELLTVREGGRDILPGFELIHIQRYILWRVFDLGWTTERFGQFDRFSIGYHGREASKAERIGKKYQWIAYHEIMAFISDHFQYRGPYGYCGDRSYDGPWQDRFRDIDPSCTLRALKGGTSWGGHSPAWWGAVMYDNWGEPGNPRGWALNRDDLPNVKELLRIVNPEDGSSWFNVQGSFLWKQPVPVDKESSDMERRDLWYSCTGYLIRTKDSERFIKWAGNKDLWNQRMPEPPEVHQMFLGEHGWAPASHFFQQPYYGDDGWTQAGHDCPVKIRTVTVKYLCEGSGFDCSVDESFTLRLPQSDLLEGLGIRWNGFGADYVDSSGKLAVFDPTAHAEGPSALLLREDLLREFLQREDLTICWVINGEKRVIGAGLDPRCHTTLKIVGTFVLRTDGPDGGLKFKPGV